MARRMRPIPDAWDEGRDRVMRGAPHLIVVHGPADLPSTDCVIALTYLELYTAISFDCEGCGCLLVSVRLIN